MTLMRRTGFLPWNEFKRVIRDLERDGRWRDMMLFGIGVYCGMRIGDMLKLRWEDVVGEKIVIREEKTGKSREIPVSKELADIVSRASEICTIPVDHIFVSLSKNNTGGVMTKQAVNQRLKKIFEEYKLDYKGNVSSHLFRKTMGRRVMEVNDYKGESLILLSKAFNHSSPAVTMVYLGLQQEEVNKVYNGLG